MPASIELVAAYPPAAGPRSGFRLRGIVFASSFGIGPLLGGVFTDYVSWRAIFWLELVLSALAALVAFPLFRVSSSLSKTPTRDLTGALLSALLVLVGVGATFRVSSWGWWSWQTATTVSLFGAIAVALCRVESRAREPALHRGLLRDRIVVGANLATVAASIGMLGLVYFFNLFAQSAATFDSAAVAVALALVPFAGSIVLFAYLAERLSKRVGYRGPVLVGLGTSIAGFAWLSLTNAGTTEQQLAIPLTLCGIGSGIANAGLTSPAVLTAAKGRLDEAAGLLSLSRFVGSALAIGIGTSTYLSVATHLPDEMTSSAGPRRSRWRWVDPCSSKP